MQPHCTEELGGSGPGRGRTPAVTRGLSPPPSAWGCEALGSSLGLSGAQSLRHCNGNTPIHSQTGSLSLFRAQDAAGLPPRTGADPEAPARAFTWRPLWVASAFLCPRPAPQTARDRLLPDGQACSLLPYVTRLCKGSRPAYIRGGRARRPAGEGEDLKGAGVP